MGDRMHTFFEKYGRLPTERDPDYLEMLRMSKYKVVDSPRFKPSKCANCGSSKINDRKYVDFGLEIDWYGIVYFCTICMADIARSVGLFDEHYETNTLLLARIEELENEKKQGVDLPDKLVNAWEEFKEYYARVNVPTAWTDSNSPVTITDAGRSIIQESNETESDKSGPAPAKSRTSKSSSSSGRKDVPSLADILSGNGS